MFTSLTHTLGEKILRETGIDFDQVTHVDLGYTYSRGWSELTPADWDYPVTVVYTSGSTVYRHDKIYSDLSEIVQELEVIADDWSDSAYE